MTALAHPLYAKGVWYWSVPEAAAALNLSKAIIYRNINVLRLKGWYWEDMGEHEEPNEPGKRGRKGHPVTVRGVTYGSYVEASAALGMQSAAIKRLVAAEQAAKDGAPTAEQLGRRGFPVFANGVRYPSKTAAAKALGRSIQFIEDQIAENIEGFWLEANGKPENQRPQSHPVTLGGVTYASKQEAAEALGVSVKIVSARAKREANATPRKPRKTTGKPVRVNGVDYPSQRAAALALGVDESVISRKVKAAEARGEDAVGEAAD